MTSTDVRGRSAREVLTWGRDLVEPVLRAAVDTLPDGLRRPSGYHFGWLDEHGTPVTSGSGKGIRVALTLLAAEAVGGPPAVAAAVAIELVHNYSLLHDDVIDGDRTRRHRPTTWVTFGPAAAILAGDALLTLAFEVIGEDPRATRLLSAAGLALAGGQAADLEFESRAVVGPGECRRMVADKTGALLGCACALGALSGGGAAAQVGAMGAFGAHLGIAFQHTDDLLGIWGDPALTGKPHADLYHRKKSLPVTAALASPTSAGRELAAIYSGEEPMTEARVARAAELVDAAGGRAWSKAESRRELAEALRHLRSAGTGRAAAELAVLAELAVHREG